MPLTVNSPTDARWDLVRRVADSIYFRKGPKLRAFLLYVCENTILGRPENVREQLIGAKVFGRPTDYSFSDDNIVRVEARELRKRLETYFANEGRSEPVVIEMPKGAYMPIFRSREDTVPPPVIEPEERLEVAAAPTPPTPLRNWRRPLMIIGLTLWVGVTSWLMIDNQRLRQSSSPLRPGLGASPAAYSTYSDLLGSLGAFPNREPQMVLCNPKVILFFGSPTVIPSSYMGGTTFAAPKEVGPLFSSALNGLDREMPYHFFRITRNDYTGTGEASAAFYLGRLMDALHRPVHLTQARFINWDNVQQQDLILLGGPSANSWTYQDETTSAFVFSGLNIKNVHPLPDEPAKYVPDDKPNPNGAMAEYGCLKMHTTSKGFRTFVVAGLSTAGTAGIAEFFATPAKMKPLADRIAAAAPGKPFPADWEVVFRTVVQDSLQVETTAVTVRPARVAR